MTHSSRCRSWLCAALMLLGCVPLARAQGYPAAPVTYHGGGYLPNVQVFTIFEGAEWETDPQLAAQMEQINLFFDFLLQSPYMDGLNQYDISYGSTVGTYVDPVPSPYIFADGDAETLLMDLNSAELLPVSPETVYFVFLSPYTTLTGPYTTAFHFGFQYSDQYFNLFTLNFAVVAYNIVPAPPNVRPGNQLDVSTAVASHELAEICSDPYGWGPGYGWTGAELTANGPEAVEICDMVEPADGFLNGYLVSDYYSDRVKGPAISAPPVPTTTKLKVSKGVIPQGSNVTATVTITPRFYSARQLTGYLYLFDGTNQVGEQLPISGNGLLPQSFSLNNLAVGKHRFQAFYTGGIGYTGSKSLTRLVHVK